MYARVTGGRANMEEVKAREQAAAAPDSEDSPIIHMPDFRGNFLLRDTRADKENSIGVWETEADLRASMAVHQNGRQPFVAAGEWVAPPTVETYEVMWKNDPSR